jgi:hypothetical protein
MVGVTQELARDSAIVLVALRSQPDWLRPRCEVILALELPPFRSEPPRYAECSATVLKVRSSGNASRLELAIARVCFVSREQIRSGYAVNDAVVSRSRKHQPLRD